MLNIIIRSYRGNQQKNSKLRINTNEIRLLAQLIIASWINVGYRNAKCFGVQPPSEREMELEYIFF
jgi:hypothetical protein